MIKVNFQAKEVILSAKQKSQMEKKLYRLKKYFNNETVTIDVLLKDETGVEKGGVDQVVHLNVNFGKEKIFIEEKDDRIARAFAYARERLERTLKRSHQKKIESEQKPGGLRLEKVWGIIKRKK